MYANNDGLLEYFSEHEEAIRALFCIVLCEDRVMAEELHDSPEELPLAAAAHLRLVHSKHQDIILALEAALSQMTEGEKAFLTSEYDGKREPCIQALKQKLGEYMVQLKRPN
jgi:hypothetical protein